MTTVNNEARLVARRGLRSEGQIPAASTRPSLALRPCCEPEIRGDQPSLGIFAAHQAEYAQHGIATFPVTVSSGAKCPAIKGYRNIGLAASAKLASKFTCHDALGFNVRPSQLFVIDIDSTDERLLDRVLQRHGRTPIITQTGSGHFHAWYRHSGEKRRLRPNPDEPIDYLGEGFVVAPPSRSEKGSYRFIQGSLDALRELPTAQWARELASDADAAAANFLDGGSIKCGRRNDALFHHCMEQAHYCDEFDAVLDVARTFASRFEPPLSDAEILKTAQSAWNYTERGENHVSRGRVITLQHDNFDRLMSYGSDSYLLYCVLRRHHWGRQFCVANRMAGQMPVGGWARPRFQKARGTLIENGEIIQVRASSLRLGPALYRWPTVSEIKHQ